MNKPEGFGTLTPYLFVEGAAAFGKFLTKAFGAIELGRTEMPDGRIANLQLRVGDTSFMVSEASSDFPAMPSSFYLYVEDADRSMKGAVEMGAEVVMEVGDMPYDDRQGGVRDPFGNLWWISQRLVDRPYH